MGKNFVENKTILVTGATDGIGFETAKALAEMGGRVLLHGRNKEKGVEAIKKISNATCSGSVDLYLADFASFSDIERMAEDIKRENAALHVLVNNAGNFYRQRSLSADGVEMTLMVNHLAPFLLTHLLLDLILASAPARIINVASSAHKMVKAVDFDNLQGEKEYDPYMAYALSKLGNVLFTQTLSERLSRTGVTVNTLHPGVVATKLLKKSYDLEGIDTVEGAATSVMLASSMEVGNVTGKYFQNKKERDPSELALDKKIQDRFWQVSEELIGSHLK